VGHVRPVRATALRTRLRLRDLGFFILYGVVGFALFETLYFVSLEQRSIAIAVALLYTAPAFVVLLGWPRPRWPAASRRRMVPTAASRQRVAHDVDGLAGDAGRGR
jgi:drug/metabolite transporter (DMT)-like permease